MMNLNERIKYSARVIREGRPTSRKFDSCFEMGDGDAVVAALVAMASGRLAENLPKYISSTSIEAAKKGLKTRWYAKETDTQGLVIDEGTGRTVAVAYDKKDTALLAAAPAMYEALEKLYIDACDRDETRDQETGEEYEDWQKCRQALEQAREDKP